MNNEYEYAANMKTGPCNLADWRDDFKKLSTLDYVIIFSEFIGHCLLLGSCLVFIGFQWDKILAWPRFGIVFGLTLFLSAVALYYHQKNWCSYIYTFAYSILAVYFAVVSGWTLGFALQHSISVTAFYAAILLIITAQLLLIARLPLSINWGAMVAISCLLYGIFYINPMLMGAAENEPLRYFLASIAFLLGLNGYALERRGAVMQSCNTSYFLSSITVMLFMALGLWRGWYQDSVHMLLVSALTILQIAAALWRRRVEFFFPAVLSTLILIIEIVDMLSFFVIDKFTFITISLGIIGAVFLLLVVLLSQWRKTKQKG